MTPNSRSAAIAHARRRPTAVAALACLLSGLQGAALAQSAADATLDTVVVTGSTRERKLTEVPYAITAVGAEALRNSGPMVNLSESLARVPGLEIVALDAGFGCCGAAGTQMLTAPGRAARFRKPLLDQLAASGATRLLSANIGCRLHLANGTALPVQHPLEFLAECLA